MKATNRTPMRDTLGTALALLAIAACVFLFCFL
jgi:hypothetical protein